MASHEWAVEHRAQEREYSRRYYRKNSGAQKLRVKRRRREIREWWKTYKAALSCSRCGESHPACLDFHHLDADSKDIMLSAISRTSWGKERILAEVAKCEVLCANCHRKLHADPSPSGEGAALIKQRPDVRIVPGLPDSP